MRSATSMTLRHCSCDIEALHRSASSRTFPPPALALALALALAPARAHPLPSRTPDSTLSAFFFSLGRFFSNLYQYLFPLWTVNRRGRLQEPLKSATGQPEQGITRQRHAQKQGTQRLYRSTGPTLEAYNVTSKTETHIYGTCCARYSGGDIYAVS